MPKQPSMPGVNLVKDYPTQQALTRIWEALHSAAGDANASAETVSSQQAVIAALQAQLEDVQKQLQLALAGGGITTASKVGGGGSGGASGGSGSGEPGGGSNPTDPPPTPDSVPNLSGDIAQAKADLIAAGIATTGSPCAVFQIVKLATWRLSGTYPQVGLLSKPSGNNCDGYATDIITWKTETGGTPTVYVFDALIDGEGAQTPTFSYKGPIDADKWMPPIPGAI